MTEIGSKYNLGKKQFIKSKKHFFQEKSAQVQSQDLKQLRNF